MVLNDKAMRFCRFLEAFVVVGIGAAAGILYAVDHVIQVAHLVQQRGRGFLYGAVKRGCEMFISWRCSVPAIHVLPQVM